MKIGVDRNSQERRSTLAIYLRAFDDLPDLLENDRSDLFTGETALLRLPGREGLTWLLLR